MTYVSDTHALVWLLEDDPQLSRHVAAIFSDPTVQIVIPTIVLAELHFLYSRGRVAVELQRVFEYIANSSNALTYPLDELVVSRLPTQLRIHDAIIVATGLVFRDVLNEPTALITQDSKIVASGLIETVW
jgi:PIN domain nuclease of toxin-antitoxin system